MNNTSLRLAPLSLTDGLLPAMAGLVQYAENGMLTWKTNVRSSLQQAIAKIDAILSRQLSELMNHPNFKSLESKWRGVDFLASKSQAGTALKLKLLPVSKSELLNDVDTAMSAEQTELFQKIYEQEFGTPGGMPYSVLMGDYEFAHTDGDIRLLNHLASIGATAICPWIVGASPALLGLNSWRELPYPRNLESVFTSREYQAWQQLREYEASRYLTLCMPRILARLPYTPGSLGVNFAFTENSESDSYCWINAAYGMTQCIINSYQQTGWPTSVRGANSGGRISHLPRFYFSDAHQKLQMVCPTEVAITDRREHELSRLGLLPLCYYKNSDYAVFFGSQTLHSPKQYDQASATANAAISARLPYLLSTARFAHYLKIIARDQLGQYMSCEEVSHWLNRWILQYVNGNAQSSPFMKAAYPLADASIQVEPVPGKPGSFQAVAWLKPWLQFEELSCSLRLVANIPKQLR
jgi:type VI secretion system protein ImpC